MVSERTTCVVAGGGPAGMVLGLLLARAGVDVQVLEKHADFLRDFRGDTVHPSTLQLLDELGLADEFADLPYSRVDEVAFPTSDGRTVVVADFRRLRVPYPYVAMVPQWDLLDLLADAAREEPGFTLRMSTEVTGLLRDEERVRGVEYRRADGTAGRIEADLVVGCDGRGPVAAAPAAPRAGATDPRRPAHGTSEADAGAAAARAAHDGGHGLPDRGRVQAGARAAVRRTTQ